LFIALSNANELLFAQRFDTAFPQCYNVSR